MAKVREESASDHDHQTCARISVGEMYPLYFLKMDVKLLAINSNLAKLSKMHPLLFLRNVIFPPTLAYI